MGAKITIELDEDMVNDLVLQDLISHFENSDMAVEQAYALAVVIKYYSTKREWNQFVERNQNTASINLKGVY